MLYDYFAWDVGGNQIAREAIDAETLRMHVRNLVVSGYRIQVREHGTEDWKNGDGFAV